MKRVDRLLRAVFVLLAVPGMTLCGDVFASAQEFGLAGGPQEEELFLEQTALEYSDEELPGAVAPLTFHACGSSVERTAFPATAKCIEASLISGCSYYNYWLSPLGKEVCGGSLLSGSSGNDTTSCEDGRCLGSAFYKTGRDPRSWTICKVAEFDYAPNGTCMSVTYRWYPDAKPRDGGKYTLKVFGKSCTYSPPLPPICYQGPLLYSGSFNLTQGTTALPNLALFKPGAWSGRLVISNTPGTNSDDSPLYSTDTLYIDWAVRNSGTAAANTGFQCTLEVDGRVVRTWAVPAPFAVGRRKYVGDCRVGPLTAGKHIITVKVDSTEAVAETNGNDNIVTRTITIQ